MNNTTFFSELLAISPYINLVEHCIIVLCQIASALTMGTLLLLYSTCRHLLQVKELSSSMLIYMVHVFITSTLPMAYHIYLIVLWSDRPKRGQYNPNVLLWTGLWQLNFSITTTMAVFWLTMDRCLVLMLPITMHSRRMKKMFFAISILSIAGAHLYNSLTYFMELPFSPETACQGFVCLLQKSNALPQIYFKLVWGILDLFGACLFIGYLHLHKAQLTNIKNRTIKFTVLSEIFLNVGPNVVTFAYTLIFGFSPSIYFGEYIVFFFSIDMLLNSLYYAHYALVAKNYPQNMALNVNISPGGGFGFGSISVQPAVA